MIKLLSGAAGLWLSLSVAHAADFPPFSIDLLSWARASPADIGCRMEKLLGHRDARFNCDLKNYESSGDPCKNTTAYYEGPTFPKELAARVHPLAIAVDLSFEHGALQSIIVRLDGDFSEQQVLQALSLRAVADRDDNIMSISIQHANGTSLEIQGFDHMGGGDVDCPDPDAKPKSP